MASRSYYRWLVVGTVCIGAFMGQLDASIAQLVLPVLERDFHRDLSAISWVALIYSLALAVFLPVFGRLADLYGRKLLYTAGFLVFILGSGLCGTAPGLPFLVGARALQAVGAALLQTNSIAIVLTAVGKQRRGRGIGLQASAQAAGLSAGPAIGGLLIHALSWRWVFWINVPIGLLGAAMGWLVLPRMRGRRGDGEFDWGGVALLAPALCALVLAINQGHLWGVESPAFIFCILVPLVLLPLLFRWEGRRRAPLLDFALFRRHAFWAGNLAGLLSYAVLFGMFFLLPFVFERAFGEGPLVVGLQLMVIPAALGMMSPLSGVLYDRLGSRPLTVTGMVLALCACLWLDVEMNASTPDMPSVVAALALFGFGEGLFTSPNNSAVMASSPEAEIGQAGGLLNVTRSFGTSIGVAASAAVFSWRLRTSGSLSTLHASPAQLVAAAHYVLAMFSLFALVACALSWTLPHKQERSETDKLVTT
ncbi:MAG TPA: MFS transporter [Bradyrhizobium sp.]|nr:MFS transporter [Bradyrhizobium sp.]